MFLRAVSSLTGLSRPGPASVLLKRAPPAFGFPEPAPGLGQSSRQERSWAGRVSGAEPVPNPDRRRRELDLFLEDGPEDLEELAGEVVSAERRKRKATKLRRLAKQFSPPGPPERRLTWDAMEQIRYLNRDTPEEWTVGRLAEGFGVSSDVIHRVLRSKFIPPPERQQKQDGRVFARTGCQSLLGSVKQDARLAQVPATAAAMLTPGVGEVQAERGGSSLALGQEATAVLLASPRGTLAPHGTARLGVPATQDPPRLGKISESSQDITPGEEEGVRVLDDEELEKLLSNPSPKPLEVVQVGSEFYDGEGNFLYRI
uniref:Neugrin n=1 Tax=Lepisosteus oculatus TaxID=7918 RepID=W5N3C8_LEPOC|nr:PREDICTED: neugrin [Lepisosteus oculatus]XP_015198054.1 PREDICTED: neugrin [Lepisosteus oculatus]XP_015198056.1 PREDICTED: neugrin [Lepisosteus oculatus]